MQFIVIIFTESTIISSQRLFLIDEHYLITWISKPLIISNQRRLSKIVLGKDDLFFLETQHLLFPTF